MLIPSPLPDPVHIFWGLRPSTTLLFVGAQLIYGFDCRCPHIVRPMLKQNNSGIGANRSIDVQFLQPIKYCYPSTLNSKCLSLFPSYTAATCTSLSFGSYYSFTFRSPTPWERCMIFFARHRWWGGYLLTFWAPATLWKALGPCLKSRSSIRVRVQGAMAPYSEKS